MTEKESLIRREVESLESLKALLKKGDDDAFLFTLTDEDMLTLVGNVDNDQRFMSPWLDELALTHGDNALAVARATASRELLARGLIGPELMFARAQRREPVGDPARVTANIALTGMLTWRTAAPVRVDAVPLHEPEERKGLGGLSLFVLPDVGVLVESTSDRGLHGFRLSSISSAKNALEAHVAFRGRFASKSTREEEPLTSELSIERLLQAGGIDREGGRIYSATQLQRSLRENKEFESLYVLETTIETLVMRESGGGSMEGIAVSREDLGDLMSRLLSP